MIVRPDQGSNDNDVDVDGGGDYDDDDDDTAPALRTVIVSLDPGWEAGHMEDMTTRQAADLSNQSKICILFLLKFSSSTPHVDYTYFNWCCCQEGLETDAEENILIMENMLISWFKQFLCRNVWGMVVQAEAKNMMEVLWKARFRACFLAAQTMIVLFILIFSLVCRS